MAQQLIMKQYGIDAVRWLCSHENAGLFLDPGLGKTAITLLAYKLLKSQGVVDKLFVIAPLRVASIVWPSEVLKWEPFQDLKICVLHGSDKNKTVKKNVDIYVINPDGLPWLSKDISLFKKNKWMLVCDESTLFKNHTSQRFKILKRLLPLFVRRVILTGTPAPNGLIQLWPQVFILDQGKRLSKYITQFRNTYFRPAGYMGYAYELIEGSEQRIYSSVNDIIMHKSSNELDLPEIMYNTIEIELSPKIRTMYNDMKKHYIAEYGEEQLAVAVNAATAGSKLKQISNGGIYNENREHVILHMEKVKVIEDLLEELGGRPLLVIYEYNHDLSRLKSVLPAPHIGAGVDSKTLGKTINDWNNSKLPLLYLQPQAGGHGLNLQGGTCNAVVWFSIPFDLELYEQANRRVHRQGVKNTVTIHHIVSKNTVDENIMKVLDKKDKLQSALLEALLK